MHVYMLNTGLGFVGCVFFFFFKAYYSKVRTQETSLCLVVFKILYRSLRTISVTSITLYLHTYFTTEQVIQLHE